MGGKVLDVQIETLIHFEFLAFEDTEIIMKFKHRFFFLAYLYSSSKLSLYAHQISLNPSCNLQPLLLWPIYVFILVEKKR